MGRKQMGVTSSALCFWPELGLIGLQKPRSENQAYNEITAIYENKKKPWLDVF
jgi:hypothetical protein